ncbi:unnamed protein product, partial [marine sediment metagenome]
RDYLAKELPDYMIPSFFIILEKLPLTPNGKIDRKALPAPEFKADKKYIAPTNNIEKELTIIWANLLGVEQNKISINNNFFDLGGHSLKGITLISKIHKKLKVEVPLNEIFKNPTIKE